MTDVILIQTTSSEKSILSGMASQLVEQKLAACCQVSGPLESHYRWDGKVETSTEWSCTIKTTGAMKERVIQSIRKLHNYDLPEIICFEITDGDPEYLDWIRSEVAGS